MFVKYLYLEDELDGLHPWLRGVKTPTLKQIMDALSKLDGEARSMMLIAEGPPIPESGLPFSGKAMVIGGGANDRYCCDAHIENAYSTMSLYDPNSFGSDEQIPIKRGQLTTTGVAFVVDKHSVIAAVQIFAKRGKLSNALHWYENE